MAVGRTAGGQSAVRSGLKVRKIQRGRLSQPRRMSRVILEVIAGLRVDQDVQAIAVRLEPRDQRIELLRVERELAAPVRMRAYELLMDSTHRHTESRGRRLA